MSLQVSFFLVATALFSLLVAAQWTRNDLYKRLREAQDNERSARHRDPTIPDDMLTEDAAARGANAVRWYCCVFGSGIIIGAWLIWYTWFFEG